MHMHKGEIQIDIRDEAERKKQIKTYSSHAALATCIVTATARRSHIPRRPPRQRASKRQKKGRTSEKKKSGLREERRREEKKHT